jgi:hypothetical protein
VCDLRDEHREAGGERRTGADHPAAHVTDAAQRLVAAVHGLGPVLGFKSVVHRCKQNQSALRKP